MKVFKENIGESVRGLVRRAILESVSFDNNKTFTPPSNVSAKASSALKIVSSNNLIEKGTNAGSGLSKAKELSNNVTQSFDMMRRMKSFFDTNQEAYNSELSSGKNINNSGIIQSWELHGGNSGRDWVKQSMSTLKDSNLKTKENLRKAGGAGKNKGMGIFDTNTMKTNNHRIHR